MTQSATFLLPSLDQATLGLMKTPRCSLPDVSDAEVTVGRRKRSLAPQNKWNKRHLSWRYNEILAPPHTMFNPPSFTCLKKMNVCYLACVFLKCLLGLNCKLQHLALRYSVFVLDSRMVSSQSGSSGVVWGKFLRKPIDETCNLNTCLLSNRHFNTHTQHLCLLIHKRSLSHAPLPKCMTDRLIHTTNLINKNKYSYTSST